METVTEIVVTGLSVGTPVQDWAMRPGSSRMLVKHPERVWDFLPTTPRHD